MEWSTTFLSPTMLLTSTTPHISSQTEMAKKQRAQDQVMHHIIPLNKAESHIYTAEIEKAIRRLTDPDYESPLEECRRFPAYRGRRGSGRRPAPPAQNNRKAKRRKTSAEGAVVTGSIQGNDELGSNVDEELVEGAENNRVTLIEREFAIDLEGIAGAEKLEDLLRAHNGYIDLPVRISACMDNKDEIRHEDELKKDVVIKIRYDYQQDLIRLQRCQIDGKNRDNENEDNFIASILYDLSFADYVAGAHKQLRQSIRKGEHFHLSLRLKLGANSHNLSMANLSLALTMNTSHEWTAESLAGADMWWDHLFCYLPDVNGDTNWYKAFEARFTRRAQYWKRWHGHKKYETLHGGGVFYNVVQGLPKEDIPPGSIQRPELECDLLPFQARAVRWMLNREGVDIAEGSDLVPYSANKGDLPPLFSRNKDIKGKECYISPVLGMVSTDSNGICQEWDDLRGGLLAEEMGLGKTVELIALITIHKRPPVVEPFVHDAYSGKMLRPSGATLIISPSSILRQWESELNTHAPHLKIYHYKGVMRRTRQGQFTVDHVMAEELLDYDIVLTSYDVLSSEIHFAQELPDRKLRRKGYEFKPIRSPLVEIGWWRVCLDEAQMIESGVSAAAEVAVLVPRINAWCITGTPVRTQLADLRGLLIFLRYHPLTQHAMFKRLLEHPPTFTKLFQHITLRHTKAMVRDEIYLPPQKRVIVTVQFSPIEEVNYNTNFERMCQECQLDENGECPELRGVNWKTLDGGNPWVSKEEREEVLGNMRRWLVRLRQICSHAQVGRRYYYGGGGGGRGRMLGDGAPLRTVEEVLDQMIEQHQTQMRTNERNLFMAVLKKGQVLEYFEQREAALKTYQEVHDQLQPVIKQCRENLAEEQKNIKKQLQQVKGAEETGANGVTPANSKGKGKAKDEDEEYEEEAGDSESDIEDDEEDILDRSTKLGTLRLRLRHFLEVEHATLFFLGSIYYQLKVAIGEDTGDLKAPQALEYGELESKFYEEAKLIRKELLTETESKAEKLISIINQKSSTKSWAEIPELPPPVLKGGIETQTVVADLEILSASLNTQANHLDEWREEMIKILTSPLIDQNDDAAQGDEFEESLAQQEKGFAYIDAINMAIADREQLLTGYLNMLAEQELARALERKENHTKILRKLVVERNAWKLQGLHSMKALINRLKAIVTTFKAGGKRAEMERQLAEEELGKVQNLYNAQVKVIARLKREADIYRVTINARVDFYRQLQTVSDSVVPFEPEKNSEITLASVEGMKQEEEALRTKIALERSKGNYLMHLKASEADDGRTCIICQCDFEDGCLTVCGHQYCQECLGAWFKQHRSCPMCKLKLKAADIYHITHNPKQVVEAQEEEHVSSVNNTGSDAVHAIYSDIKGSMFEQIKSILLNNSFGSKIDMICRHLLWLSKTDPIAQSVIFSQWSDVLRVFEQAFTVNGISYATFEKDGVTRFKNDPSIKCFLLHSKSQSAGLTLVNATHVFICEPIMNAGLELQAISRVHRIGQTKPTTVWQYVVSSTVEQAVLNLAIQRRLALMGVQVKPFEENGEDVIPAISETKLDEANSAQLTQAVQLVSARGGQDGAGGEVVANEDIVGCLVESAKDRLRRKTAGMEVRRHLMADAAGSRMAQAQELVVAAGPSRR